MEYLYVMNLQNMEFLELQLQDLKTFVSRRWPMMMLLIDGVTGVWHWECKPKGEVWSWPEERDQEAAALQGSDKDMDPIQWNQGQEGVSVFLILSSFVWGSRTSVPCCWSHKAIHATQVREGVFWKLLTFMGFWACAVTTWCSKTNRKGDGEVQSVWEGDEDKSIFQRRPRPATKNSVVSPCTYVWI